MKKLYCAMLVALAGLSTQAVAADDQGEWYIGGYLYYVETRGSDEKLFTPGQPANNTAIPPTPAVPEMNEHFHSQYDKDAGYGIVFGYDFAGALRAEMAIRQFANDITEFNDTSGNPVITGEAEAMSVMGNLWFDFNRDASWRPYIGFGVGYADITKGEFEEDTTMLQVGAGVNVDISDNLVMDIGYRYVDADEPEYELSGGRTLETEYTANVIAVGLRYGFNRGPAPDSDGDGVADSADQCPGTPLGRKVDERGCEFDSDGDGVVDGDDACPSTEPGVEVLDNGCAAGQSLVLKGVNFEFDSATLTYNAERILDVVARTLLDAPTFAVELQGHTDAYGTDEYNLALSKRRTAAVKRYLVKKGVSSTRLRAVGFGETRPVATNSTSDGRAQNRRVELHVISDGENTVAPTPYEEEPTYEYQEEPTVEPLPAAEPAEDAPMEEEAAEAEASADEPAAAEPAAEESAAEEPAAAEPAYEEEQESFDADEEEESYDVEDLPADDGGAFDPYAAYE